MSETRHIESNGNASGNTRYIKYSNDNTPEVRNIILSVFDALQEKGYNPVSQLIGYILSDDPTYITTHNNARNLIRRYDRYELLQAILSDYINSADNRK